MRTLRILGMVLAVVVFGASPLMAADTVGANSPFYGNAIAAGLGAAITIVGAGWGFGRIGAAALESMARQPETAARVQTAMLIIAAMFEGAPLLSLIICLLLSLKA